MNLQTVRRSVKTRLLKYQKRKLMRTFPARGFEAQAQPIPFVDPLSDADLAELNRILDWNCFVADGQGRRFGSIAWAGKRTAPQAIPDPRIVGLDERFGLADKTVLEVGCFEGIHTIALAQRARAVTAVDGRLENVVKTIVRTAFFGLNPTVFKCDLEAPGPLGERLRADVVHHCGVLYHLQDPVKHLQDLAELIGHGVMLDTHYSLPEEATAAYTVGGRTYRYKHYIESGHADVFSGLYAHSKWLLLDDLIGLLKAGGFTDVEVAETRAERNGPRVLLYARRG